MENLDINVLNHRALKKIIDGEKFKRNQTYHQFRRQYQLPEKELIYDNDKVLEKKIFLMMQQSIYSARYRLAETKPLRIRLRNNSIYHIGIIVANVYQIVQRCEHIYNQLINYDNHTFFLWRLIIYEKILACHTDVEDLVQRAFVLQHGIDAVGADVASEQMKKKGNGSSENGTPGKDLKLPGDVPGITVPGRGPPPGERVVDHNNGVINGAGSGNTP